MQALYTTREAVLRSFEIANTTRISPMVDNEIRAASESVDHQLHRFFTVEKITLAFDWPNYQHADAWRIYFNEQSFITIDTVVSGGLTLDPADYLPYRADGVLAPPYEYIEINRARSAAFSSGLSPQRSIMFSGLTGVQDLTSSGGVLTPGMDATTSIAFIDPVNGRMYVGVGSSLIIGNERLQVTERGWSDSGTVLLTSLGSIQSDNIVEMSDTTKVALYEYLHIGGESVQVLSIVGSNVTVRRAVNGSVLATHESGCPIYLNNAFSVTRGAFGTSAAVHAGSAPVLIQRYPAQVEQLSLAEAVVGVAQNAGLYARIVGQGSSTREAVGKGLDDMRRAAYQSWGRKLRKTAI